VKIIHVGAQGPVYIPAFDADIEPGETIDVPDVAAATALLAQPANFLPGDDEAKKIVAGFVEGAAQVAQFAAELVEWQTAAEAQARAEWEAAQQVAFTRVAADAIVEDLASPPDPVKPARKGKPGTPAE
jgi:hypothetical protein